VRRKPNIFGFLEREYLKNYFKGNHFSKIFINFALEIFNK